MYYLQADDRIKIVRVCKDSKTKKTAPFNVMSRWGCLFLSLIYTVVDRADCYITEYMIKSLYKICIDKKLMKADCYVLDHARIIEEAYKHLTGMSKPVKYLGADYLGRKPNWGTNENYNAMIIQHKTIYGNSHFRCPFFDTLGNRKHPTVLSLRYYRIGV